MFTGAGGQPDLFASSQQRLASVHYQLFRNAGSSPQPGPAHRQDTTDEDIAYWLQACKDNAALGGQVVGVCAYPDAVQTLMMQFADYVCQQCRVETLSTVCWQC